MNEPTNTEQSYGRALDTARKARVHLIDLTYQLPKGFPAADIGRLWSNAETALLDFIRVLEREESRSLSPRPDDPREATR